MTSGSRAFIQWRRVAEVAHYKRTLDNFHQKLIEITTHEQNDDGDDDDRICSLEEKPVTNFH